MKILSKLNNTEMIEETADKRYVTDAEKLKWNGKADKTYVDSQDALKADKTYVDSKVQTDVPAGAKFTDTVTTINGQAGDIELTADDINYFDYSAGYNRNVGSTLSEISETISAFILYVVGVDYNAQNDPTLKELLKMLTIILGDYELGVAPSLGDIVKVKADKTYVDDKVKTDVPVGAKFTDTHLVESVNGKVGEIVLNSSDIEVNASDIMVRSFNGDINFDTDLATAFPLVADRAYSSMTLEEIVPFFTEILSVIEEKVDKVDGKELSTNDYDNSAKTEVAKVKNKADTTYVDDKVKTDVPSGAKFTDTIYTHPTSHPASMITESATKRFVTDVEKANWDSVVDKVDKVAGKQLSTNDYTTVEKNKLSGVDNNATHNPNVSSDSLTLGGRFKVVYNDIEDSLDIEVI